MSSTVDLHFSKRPSLLYNFFHAIVYLLRRNYGFSGADSIPTINAYIDRFLIDQKHLAEFNKVCKIPDGNELSLIYPLTLIFPLFQRMLTLKQIPLSVFNALGKRLQISQYRKIRMDETLDIHCEITGYRIAPKGIELYLSGIIQSAGEVVWEATETFFYRGHFGEPDASYEYPQFDKIEGNPNSFEWFLPEKLGLRFAKISGDANGIHYFKTYAKALGFERDFAQPFLILGTSLNVIPNMNVYDAVSLDVLFKGQFYYKRDVMIKSIAINDIHRFDLYSEGNDLPCIVGMLKPEQTVNFLNKSATGG